MTRDIDDLFTAGPWKIGSWTRDDTVVGTDEYIVAANILEIENARLIAAAPELLQAVEELLEAANGLEVGNPHGFDIAEAKAEKLLARIRGEE